MTIRLLRVKKSLLKDSAAFAKLRPQPYFYTEVIWKPIYSQSDVYCIIKIKITPLQLKKPSEVSFHGSVK
jgi:hypothetical protein